MQTSAGADLRSGRAVQDLRGCRLGLVVQVAQYDHGPVLTVPSEEFAGSAPRRDRRHGVRAGRLAHRSQAGIPPAHRRRGHGRAVPAAAARLDEALPGNSLGFGAPVHRARSSTRPRADATAADGTPGDLAVDRLVLRHILLAGLEDRVVFGKELQRYVAHDGDVTAYFSDGSSARGDVLIAADGIGSAVRRQYLPHARVVDTGVWQLYGDRPAHRPNGCTVRRAHARHLHGDRGARRCVRRRCSRRVRRGAARGFDPACTLDQSPLGRPPAPSTMTTTSIRATS